MLFDWNINYKSKQKVLGKSPNIWKLYNVLLNNHWIKKDMKRKIRKEF